VTEIPIDPYLSGSWNERERYSSMTSKKEGRKKKTSKQDNQI